MANHFACIGLWDGDMQQSFEKLAPLLEPLHAPAPQLELPVELDDDVVLSTSPLAANTSWGNRLFRLDRAVSAGETMRLRLRMGQLVDASTWSVTEQ